VAGNVDSQFPHHGNSLRPDVGWLGSGAEDLETIPRIVAKKAFRHLAPGRVSRAENENWFVLCGWACGTTTLSASLESDGTSRQKNGGAHNGQVISVPSE
jgi:hypothetical protein